MIFFPVAYYYYSRQFLILLFLLVFTSVSSQQTQPGDVVKTLESTGPVVTTISESGAGSLFIDGATPQNCEITIRDSKLEQGAIRFKHTLRLGRNCKILIENCAAAELKLDGEWNGGVSITVRSSVFVSVGRGRPAMTLGSFKAGSYPAYSALILENSQFHRAARDGEEDSDGFCVPGEVGAVCISAPVCRTSEAEDASCSSGQAQPPRIVLRNVNTSIALPASKLGAIYIIGRSRTICPCWKLQVENSRVACTSQLGGTGLAVHGIAPPTAFSLTKSDIRINTTVSGKSIAVKFWSSDENAKDATGRDLQARWVVEENRKILLSRTASSATGFAVSSPVSKGHRHLLTLLSYSRNVIVLDATPAATSRASATIFLSSMQPATMIGINNLTMNENRATITVRVGGGGTSQQQQQGEAFFFDNFWIAHNSIAASIDKNTVNVVSQRSGVIFIARKADAMEYKQFSGFTVRGNNWSISINKTAADPQQGGTPAAAKASSFVNLGAKIEPQNSGSSSSSSSVIISDNFFTVRDSTRSLHSVFSVVTLGFETVRAAVDELRFLRNAIYIEGLRAKHISCISHEHFARAVRVCDNRVIFKNIGLDPSVLFLSAFLHRLIPSPSGGDMQDVALAVEHSRNELTVRASVFQVSAFFVAPAEPSRTPIKFSSFIFHQNSVDIEARDEDAPAAVNEALHNAGVFLVLLPSIDDQRNNVVSFVSGSVALTENRLELDHLESSSSWNDVSFIRSISSAAIVFGGDVHMLNFSNNKLSVNERSSSAGKPCNANSRIMVLPFVVALYGPSEGPGSIFLDRNVVHAQCVDFFGAFRFEVAWIPDESEDGTFGVLQLLRSPLHVRGRFSVCANTFRVGDAGQSDAAGPRGFAAGGIVLEFHRLSPLLVGEDLVFQSNSFILQQATKLKNADSFTVVNLDSLVDLGGDFIFTNNDVFYRSSFMNNNGGPVFLEASGYSRTATGGLPTRIVGTVRGRFIVEHNVARNFRVLLLVGLHARSDVSVINNTLRASLLRTVSREFCVEGCSTEAALVSIWSNFSFSKAVSILNNRVYFNSEIEGIPLETRSQPFSMTTTPTAVRILQVGVVTHRIFFEGEASIDVRGNVVEAFSSADVVGVDMASFVMCSCFLEIFNAAAEGAADVFPLGGVGKSPSSSSSSSRLKINIVENKLFSSAPRAMGFVSMMPLPGAGGGGLHFAHNEILLSASNRIRMVGGVLAEPTPSADETGRGLPFVSLVEHNVMRALDPGESYRSAIISGFRHQNPRGENTFCVSIFSTALPMDIFVIPRTRAARTTYPLLYSVTLRSNVVRAAGGQQGGRGFASLLSLMNPNWRTDPMVPTYQTTKEPFEKATIFAFDNEVATGLYGGGGGGEGENRLLLKWGPAVATEMKADIMLAQKLPKFNQFRATKLQLGADFSRRINITIGGGKCNRARNIDENNRGRTLNAPIFRAQLPHSFIRVVDRRGAVVANERGASCGESWSATVSETATRTVSLNVTKVSRTATKTQCVDCPPVFGMSAADAASRTAAVMTLSAVAGLGAPAAALSAARAMAVFALLSCGGGGAGAAQETVPVWWWRMRASGAVGLFVGIIAAAALAAVVMGIWTERSRRKNAAVKLEELREDREIRNRTIDNNSNTSISAFSSSLLGAADEHSQRTEVQLEFQLRAAGKRSLWRAGLDCSPVNYVLGKGAAQLAGMWGVSSGILCATGGAALGIIPILLLLAAIAFFSWKTHQILFPQKRNEKEAESNTTTTAAASAAAAPPPPPPPRVAPCLLYRPPSAPQSGISHWLAGVLTKYAAARFLVTGYYCWVPVNVDDALGDSISALRRSSRRRDLAFEDFERRQFAADIFVRNRTVMTKFWGAGLRPRQEQRAVEMDADRGLDHLAAAAAGRNNNNSSSSSSSRRRRQREEQAVASEKQSCWESSFIVCSPNYARQKTSWLFKFRTFLSPHFLAVSILVTVLVCLAQGAAMSVGDRHGGCTHALRFVTTCNVVFAVVVVVMRPFLVPVHNIMMCTLEIIIAIISILASALVFEAGRTEAAPALQEAIAVSTSIVSSFFLVYIVLRRVLLAVANAEVVPRSNFFSIARRDFVQEMAVRTEAESRRRRVAEEDDISDLLWPTPSPQQMRRLRNPARAAREDQQRLEQEQQRQRVGSGTRHSPREMEERLQQHSHHHHHRATPTRATTTRSFDASFAGGPAADRRQRAGSNLQQQQRSRFTDI